MRRRERHHDGERGTRWEGPLLEVDDLKTYFDTPRGEVHAVDGVTFELDEGHTLGVVGESGSGKTVLSRSVMNLLPKTTAIPAGGSVRFAGRDIRGLSPRELRDIWGVEMAMIFQDPMTSLNPVVKIGRQITEHLRYHLDMSRSDAEETALELLRSVGIPEPRRRLREYPHQLSGGMRQRVTIAIALACGPRLLIADEPTTALDVTVQKQILDLLETQQRERNMAMMLITHDLGVVAGRTDHIIVMYAAEVAEKAPTTVLFRDMKHPYTEALLNSIPKVENASHTELQAIPGRPPNLISPPAGCRFAARCPKATDRCRAEPPPVIAERADRTYRCWLPLTSARELERLQSSPAADEGLHARGD